VYRLESSVPLMIMSIRRPVGGNENSIAIPAFAGIRWSLRTMLIAVIATITNLQAFDQIYVLTQGGPFFRTETLVMMMYRVGFENLKFGYAAALSYVLVFILTIVSFVQVSYFRRRSVQY